MSAADRRVDPKTRDRQPLGNCAAGPTNGSARAEKKALVVQKQPTVFVVDPESESRTVRAVRTLVDMMSWRCELYSNGTAFLQAIDSSHIGCVVLEALHDRVNGLQVQQRLNERQVKLPLIFVSAKDSASLAVRALRGGALHFLHKPFGENELWDAIHEAIEFEREQRSVRELRGKYWDLLCELTDAEMDVIERFAQGQHKTETAEQLNICVRTVELRKKRAMKKMGAKSSSDLLRMVLIAKGPSFMSASQPDGPSAEDFDSHRPSRNWPK